ALDGDCHRLAVKRYILFFRRIEIRKCKQWQILLLLVRRNYHFESLCAADPNFIVLLELRRRRIFVPTVLILEQRRIYPIEIAASGDCCCDCDRITYLHALRLGIGRHGKASNRSGETWRRIWWQRFYLKRHRVTRYLNVATFAEPSKWIGEEW